MRQPAKFSSKPISRRQKARANPVKRSLNALAIADAQTKDNRGQKSHRLGEIDEGGPSGSWSRKRPLEENGDDLNGGSDSDGNEWKIGVDSDNDSDIDSDEAFGDSDEERYEGYVFRGSSKFKDQRSKENTGVEISGNDDEQVSDEEDGLIDLATALDQADNFSAGDSDDSLEGEDETEEVSHSDSDFTAEDEEGISGKPSALQDLVSSLPALEPAKKRQKLQDGLEMQPDSIFAVPTKRKLTLEDMMTFVTDPTLRKSLKMIDTSRDTTAKRGQARKLDVPLPQRQQDRINRSAAYEKTNETLGRWVETIKLNRRADHLQFPLPGSGSAPVLQSKKIVSGAAPVTSLEQKIHDLMVESGLAGPDTGEKSDDEDEDEDAERGFEELKANKLNLAEIQAKRAELRLARELIFREEKRAKRIKKIKSKSYRRVLRKQAEKEDKQSAAALAAAGIEIDDPEALEIQRAEARMGSRHRDSKWAKNAKRSGKTIWDQDVKAGMIEMAQKQEELTRRIQGRSSRSEDWSDSSEEDDASSDEKDVNETLELLKGGTLITPGKKTGLMALKFMQRAQNDLRLQNESAIDDIKRDLHGLPPREIESLETGRKKYGKTSSLIMKGESRTSPSRADVHNSEASSDENEAPEDEVEIVFKQQSSSKPSNRKATKLDDDSESANPWLSIKSENKSKRKPLPSFIHKPLSNTETDKGNLNGSGRKYKEGSEVLIDPKAILEVHRGNLRPKNDLSPENTRMRSKILTLQPDEISDGDSTSEPEQTEMSKESRDDLVRRAFAGDDVLAEFQKEKADVMEEDDEKTIDTTLPGWGSWTGDGLSKKEQSRNRGRFFVKKEGLKKEDRKDVKLDRVIINEKRIRKNSVFLASTLPHPFETRQQYERSLRLPVGPEWTTKETFQKATKPRVLLKQGIIDPISRPVL